MKKAVFLLLVLSLVMGMACTALAAEGDFVPSITYKDAPDLVESTDSEGNKFVGQIVDSTGAVVESAGADSLVITSVAQGKDTTQIPEERKEELLNLYEELSSGTMEVPYEMIEESLADQDLVVRDLFDVFWSSEENPDAIEQPDANLVVTFDLGVNASTVVYGMSYYNGNWYPAVSVVNNGDGTVTCVFSTQGIVAFSVARAEAMPPTGDTMAKDLYWYVGILAFSGVALVVLLILPRKKKNS